MDSDSSTDFFLVGFALEHPCYCQSRMNINKTYPDHRATFLRLLGRGISLLISGQLQ